MRRWHEGNQSGDQSTSMSSTAKYTSLNYVVSSLFRFWSWLPSFTWSLHLFRLHLPVCFFLSMWIIKKHLTFTNRISCLYSVHFRISIQNSAAVFYHWPQKARSNLLRLYPITESFKPIPQIYSTLSQYHVKCCVINKSSTKLTDLPEMINVIHGTQIDRYTNSFKRRSV